MSGNLRTEALASRDALIEKTKTAEQLVDKYRGSDPRLKNWRDLRFNGWQDVFPLAGGMRPVLDRYSVPGDLLAALEAFHKAKTDYNFYCNQVDFDTRSLLKVGIPEEDREMTHD
jgi:hypothetical protein